VFSLRTVQEIAVEQIKRCSQFDVAGLCDLAQPRLPGFRTMSRKSGKPDLREGKGGVFGMML
jgi:hypothetical protein